MPFDVIARPLLGGVLIGFAAILLLLFDGRVAGVSGIVAGGLQKPTSKNSWRWCFVVGMLLGGLLLWLFDPMLLANHSNRGLIIVAAAGLLVGYGTVMAGGCTSGHGVCGISRFSRRSIVATMTFIVSGILTVQVVGWLAGVAP